MLAIRTRVVSNKLWIDAVKQANLQDLPWAQNNVSMPCPQELRVLWQPRGSLLKANQALKNLSNSMSCMKMHLIKSIKSSPWRKQLSEPMKLLHQASSWLVLTVKIKLAACVKLEATAANSVKVTVHIADAHMYLLWISRSLRLRCVRMQKIFCRALKLSFLGKDNKNADSYSIWPWSRKIKDKDEISLWEEKLESSNVFSMLLYCL